MGSHLFAGMPRTGRYRQVIALLGDSAGGGGAPGIAVGTLEQIADVTLQASLVGLELAKSDEGLAYCVYLIVQLTRASRQEDFLLALDRAGIPMAATISGLPDVPIVTDADKYSSFDLTSGFSFAVDRQLRQNRSRSDVGELAQLSAAESLSVVCSDMANTLFGSNSGTVQTSLQSISTERGFARLAHDFLRGSSAATWNITSAASFPTMSVPAVDFATSMSITSS